MIFYIKICLPDETNGVVQSTTGFIYEDQYLVLGQMNGEDSGFREGS